MQVRPVSTIPSLDNWRRPAAASAAGEDTTGSGSFNAMNEAAAHIAAYTLNRDNYHGSQAEYATQLLASHHDYADTQLERRQLIGQYSVAQEEDSRSYTVSLSA